MRARAMYTASLTIMSAFGFVASRYDRVHVFKGASVKYATVLTATAEKSPADIENHLLRYLFTWTYTLSLLYKKLIHRNGCDALDYGVGLENITISSPSAHPNTHILHLRSLHHTYLSIHPLYYILRSAAFFLLLVNLIYWILYKS